MAKSKRHILLTVFIVGVTIAAFLSIEPTRMVRGLWHGENFNKWRPTSFWRERFRQPSVSDRVPADIAEAFSDPSGIPVLVDCLVDDDFKVRRMSARLLVDLGPIPACEPALELALNDSDPDVLITSIAGIGRLGNNARSAIPELTRLVIHDDEYVRGAAQFALWNIDRDAAIGNGWKPVSSAKWNLEALMPTPIERGKAIIQTPYGDAPLETFAGTIGAIRFTIAIAEYDARVTREFTEDDRYESAAQETAVRLGGKLLKHAVVVHHGLEGREQQIEVPGKVEIITRAFLVKNRSYQAQVAIPAGFSIDPEMVEVFFDSIEIRFDQTNPES